MHLSLLSVASIWCATTVNAHLCAWNKGMFCLNGSSGSVDLNTADPVTPLYQLPMSQWWFHHLNNCDEFPPAEGDFLELPAGGDFTVEIASNQAKTTLSYNGRDATDWPDGNTYPEDYNVPSCITSPNMHTQNQSMAAGTAFAISYVSNIKDVKPDNLAVFTVRYHTPWKRLTSYSVPAAMPACSADGCICAWGWVPNGCGQPNMYHQAFRCKVTGATSTAAVAPPKPPVWCEDDPSKCVKGSKQMIYWNQQEGDNIEVSGMDLSGHPKSPAYNAKCGFSDGAQNDIFAGSGGSQATPNTPGGSSNSNNSSAGSTSSNTSQNNNGTTPLSTSASSTAGAAGSTNSPISNDNSPSNPVSDNSAGAPPKQCKRRGQPPTKRSSIPPSAPEAIRQNHRRHHQKRLVF